MRLQSASAADEGEWGSDYGGNVEWAPRRAGDAYGQAEATGTLGACACAADVMTIVMTGRRNQ
jgi:hypothetical protein